MHKFKNTCTQAFIRISTSENTLQRGVFDVRFKNWGKLRVVSIFAFDIYTANTNYLGLCDGGVHTIGQADL